jgi:hypothetical protein
MSNTTTTPAEYDVVTMNMTDGSVQGHRAGCADLKRGRAKFAEPSQANDVLRVTSKAEARAEYNADFDEETEGWYDIEWAACANHIPAEDPATFVPVIVAATAPAKAEKAAPAKGKKATAAKSIMDAITANSPDLQAAAKKAAAKPAKAATPAKGKADSSAKKAAPAKASAKDVQAARLAALDKARAARAANALKPAPEVDGIKWQTSGKHGIVEGGSFVYHGDDRKAPAAKGRKVTMKIVDRVWITGLDTRGKEVMRAHIAKSFWATEATAPKAAKKAAAAPAKGKKATAAK